jgi:hypothetical protein
MPVPNLEPVVDSVEVGAVSRADFCAAFVIDAAGNVVAYNRTAAELWSTPRRPLVGVPFVSLVASTFAEVPAETAWHGFKANACERTVRCSLGVADGAAIEASVRLERAFGGGGSYIATVRPFTGAATE